MCSSDLADGSDAEPQGMLLLVDPGCGVVNDLIGGLDYAYPGLAKVGGIAGQHSAPHGSLLFEDSVRGGAVGCLIRGAWRLDPMVAQGCRPIGPVFEVEQAQRNVVLQVSQGSQRSSPIEALQGVLGGLSAAEREQVRHERHARPLAVAVEGEGDLGRVLVAEHLVRAQKIGRAHV